MAITDDQRDAYDAQMNPAGFGVFSDEGMVSGPFCTRRGADVARKKEDPTGESGLYVVGVCPDHEEQPAGACARCNAEDAKS